MLSGKACVRKKKWRRKNTVMRDMMRCMIASIKLYFLDSHKYGYVVLEILILFLFNVQSS